MNDPSTLLIYNDFRFWIILGMVLYLAGSFFIYILSDQMNRAAFQHYLIFTLVFYTLKNIFFALGIFIHSRQEPIKINSKDEKIPYLDIN